MVRPLLVLAAFLAWVPLGDAQDLGRADRLWRSYLSETVRRGLPLLASDPAPGVVPFWPALDRARVDARSLDPGADADLVGAWMDLQTGERSAALATLRGSWPRPALTFLSPRSWGEALFAAWDPQDDSRARTAAWLAWEDKAYSPRALLGGLEALERTDPSAVEPLLTQALRLYPEDRRFLPLVLRHPGVVSDPVGLVGRDRAAHGGFGPRALARLLDQAPETSAALQKAGYTDVSVPQDYGLWLAQAAADAPVPDGVWSWDADRDGRAESTLVFTGGKPVTWSRRTGEGSWTLTWAGDRPSRLVEDRAGSSWTLNYERYPLASTLEYRWSDRTLVYRFRPLDQSWPLAPEERFLGSPGRWPAALADVGLTLDPRALAEAAASLETWDGALRVSTLALDRGQVWLKVEDTDRDGRDDQWSYYRAGVLSAVYRDPAGAGSADLRELYRRGSLVQVQKKAPGRSGAEFALFPAEGIQLWDPHGDQRPLDRVFVWSGGRLDALVFSGTDLPWQTMPLWEPRP